MFGDAEAEEAAAKIVSGYTRPWHEPVLRYTAAGQKVLETGSGTGQLSAALAKNRRNTFLLDLSLENLKFSRSVFRYMRLKGEFIRADVLKIFPFCDNAFDCVLSQGLLEHFTDEEIDFVIKESARVSRRVVVSMVPNAASVAYRFGKWYQELKGIWRYGREVPRYTLREFFKRAGLEKVTEYSMDPQQSFEFLTMLGGRAVGEIIRKVFTLIPPKLLEVLNQGWLLVTIGEKPAGG